MWRKILIICICLISAGVIMQHRVSADTQHHYLYVFPDKAMNVYDIDNNFALIKTVVLPDSAIRGASMSTKTGMLYIAYGGYGGGTGNGSLLKYNLLTDQIVWNKHYPQPVDSGESTPDDSKYYLAGGEASSTGIWYIIDPTTGNEIGNITSNANGPHNTLISLDGKHVYLGGKSTQYMVVADTTTDKVIRQIGPLHDGAGRPFTINGKESLLFSTATDYIGFQVSDINTGKVLYTVPVPGFKDGSFGGVHTHGMSVSPDEKEAYLFDWPNDSVHVFDITGLPNRAPVLSATIKISSLAGTEAGCPFDCEREGWLLHSSDGRYVFVGDAGDVIDTQTRTIAAHIPGLTNSRKILEVDWQNNLPMFTTTTHGLGYVGSALTPMPTATSIPTPTLYINPTLMPTVQPSPNSTSLSVDVLLHGIGSGADNSNLHGSGNPSPTHPQRIVTIDLYDAQNNLVETVKGSVTFQTASGSFKGVVDLGSTIRSGIYTIKIKTDQYLRALISGIQTLTAGQQNTVPQVSLVDGDITNDNLVNVLDYNILMGCYSDLLPATNCTATNGLLSDINDDGKVNQYDYNLFLREISNSAGQ